jgi:hypothetical protein
MAFCAVTEGLAVAELVIDLSSQVPDELEPVSPSRRWRRWSGWRDLAVGLIALATLLGATAAQAQAKPAIQRLALIDDPGGSGAFGFWGNVVVRFERGGLAAYGLDGTRLWWTGLGLSLVGEVQFTEGLVSASGFSSTSNGQEEVTAVLDFVSGKEIGRISGTTHAVIAGDFLVENERFSPRTSKFRRLGTLAVAWELPPATVIGLPQSGLDSQRLVYTIDSTGVLAERELATGRVLRTVASSYPGPMGSLFVSEEVIQLIPDNRSARQLMLSRRTLLPVDRVQELRRPCGPVDCVYHSEGMNTNLFVVDKVTGRKLWEKPQYWHATATPAGLLLENGAAVSLADFTTGNDRPLPGWSRIGLGEPVQLMRRDAPSRGGTEIAMLVREGLVSLGLLPFALSDCYVSGGILVCRTTAQKIGVWRLELPRERDHY